MTVRRLMLFIIFLYFVLFGNIKLLKDCTCTIDRLAKMLNVNI